MQNNFSSKQYGVGITLSYRINENEVQISIPFEDMLTRLLGSTMYYVHGRLPQKKWLLILRKMILCIEKSTNKNITSDGFHKFRITNYIQIMKEAIQKKEVVEPEIIRCLVGIIFELLGGLPDNRQRKILNRKDDYILTLFRSLQYQQSPYQKVMTILEASKRVPFSNYHKFDELEYAYIEHNFDVVKFIDWYKKRYPQVYVKLF